MDGEMFGGRALSRLVKMAVAGALALSLSAVPVAFAQGDYVAADAADATSATDATDTTDTTDTTETTGEVEAAEPSAETDQAQEEAPQPEKAVAEESRYAEVVKVKLNKKRATIRNNGTLKLKARLVLDDDAKELKKKDGVVKWRISNSRIASVTQDGVVTGKKSGTVKVTAKAGNGKKATAKIKVVVDWGKMATAIPVLTYHRIADNRAVAAFYANDSLTTSASKFRSQLKWLNDNGYHTVTASELVGWRLHGDFLPKKSVCITLDDGFYETYHVAYPILRKYKCKATSFVIGKKVSKKTKKYRWNDGANHYIGRDALEKVKKSYPGLEFQSHTYNMHRRTPDYNGVVRSWSRQQIDADFVKNRKFGFTSIAYPFGHTSANMYASLRANESMKAAFGYPMDQPATRTSPRYNIPRFKVWGNRGLGAFIAQVGTAR